MATLIFTLAGLLLVTRLMQSLKAAEMTRLSRAAAGAMRQAIPDATALRMTRRADNEDRSNYVVVPCESEFGMKGQTYRLQRAS